MCVSGFGLEHTRWARRNQRHDGLAQLPRQGVRGEEDLRSHSGPCDRDLVASRTGVTGPYPGTGSAGSAGREVRGC